MKDSDRRRFETLLRVNQFGIDNLHDPMSASAKSAANIREGMVIVRTLEAIVKNKYANNPGKLAAWTSASHVEKAQRKNHPRHKLGTAEFVR